MLVSFLMRRSMPSHSIVTCTAGERRSWSAAASAASRACSLSAARACSSVLISALAGALSIRVSEML